MDYNLAKSIVEEIAPELGVMSEQPDQRHITVFRKDPDDGKLIGAPFSIMVPRLPLPPPIKYRAAQAETQPGEDIPGQPAMPEVQARSSEDLHTEAERAELVAAVKSAKAFLGA